MAIKASGEHKQKVGFQNTIPIFSFFVNQVNIQIAVDGLKIRDEKTGVSTFFILVLMISKPMWVMQMPTKY